VWRYFVEDVLSVHISYPNLFVTGKGVGLDANTDRTTDK
jgi:hypothetical protein